jgi:hypothetical protein
MEPGLYQRPNGLVLKFREDQTWQWLSPLLGDWLDVEYPSTETLEKYPRNEQIHNAAKPPEAP